MQYLDSNPRRSTPSFFFMVGFALMLIIQQNTTSVNAQTATPPSGSGTSGDPYLIATLDNLYWLSQNDAVWDDNAYFLQTADIDASATSTWDAGAGFSPIGNLDTGFRGTYDGGGYTISGLFINRPLTTNVGLFGNIVNTTVMNLGVIQADITGNFQTGGLIGRAQGGSIVKDSYSTGLVSSSSITGGLIGISLADSVLRVYSSAQVTSISARAAGLIANHNAGVIKDSYATGAVTATNWAGGLVAANTGSIENSYSTSRVNSTGIFVGGLVARNEGAGTITNSYWNTETSGQSSGSGTDLNGQSVTGLTTAQMRQQTNFTGFDFTDTWTMWEDFSEPYLQDVTPDSVGDYPFSFYPTGSGTSGDPYQIATLDNLFILSQLEVIWDDNAHFQQTANINASATSGWNSGAGFSPIGNDANRFSGSYNGNGHSISNLFIDRDTQSHVGLFGAADSAGFSNLTLEAVDITGLRYTGGLLGLGSQIDTLANISVSGSIEAAATSGAAFAGGVGGEVVFRGDSSYALTSSASITAAGGEVSGGLFGGFDGNLTDSHASGDVISGRGLVGGLIGNYNPEHPSTYFLNRVSASGDIFANGTAGGLVGQFLEATITNSFATGNLTNTSNTTGGFLGSAHSATITNSYASGTVSGIFDVGGFIGRNNNNSSITNSYSIGSVSGSSEVGGFVGENNLGSITNSYSIGSVSGSSEVGGFIGRNQGGSATNSYSSGSVSGSSEVGGFVGENELGIITNGYWNSQTSGQSNGIGSDNNGQNPTGLTTAEMRQDSSFVGFDFGSTWTMLNGFYEPYLQNLAPDSINGFATGSYPSGSGTFADPYLISSLEGLEILSETSTIWNSGAHFLQTTDIDASATSGWNSGAGFSPIGNDANRFSGSYNGNGYTISNLFINRNAQSHVGLFGAAEDAGFSNLTLEAVDITGLQYTGGLLGLGSQLDTLANISVSGSIEAAITGDDAFVGGIGGEVVFRGDSSYVLTSSATITTGEYYAGGLFGIFDGTLTDSHASGNVRGDGAVGGLIGAYEPETPSVYFLNRVSASGDVHATHRFAGGLIGDVFDGTISNSYASGDVHATDSNVGGLIGSVYNASISNSYSSGTISGGSSAGGFIGRSDQSSISNSHSSGMVSTVSFESGGFIGFNSNGIITNSYATGNATAGTNEAGGFVGDNVGGTITNSYARGSASGAERVGGFIGRNQGGSATNSYSSGSVSGSSEVGGFVGLNSNGTITNGYWNTQTSGQSNGIGNDTNGQTVTGLSIQEMAQQNSFAGFDFTNTWGIVEAFSEPYLQFSTPDSINGFAIPDLPSNSGTEGDPFLVSTLNDLNIFSQFASTWGSVFLQTADIDATATSGWNSGLGFSPIGSDAIRFNGSYNGNGHTISNLTINRDTLSHIGLFGAAEGAGFSNLTLEAVDITGLQYTGGLLGLGSQLDTLANISVSGSIEATIAADSIAYTGGIGGQVVFRGDSSHVLTSSATITAAGDKAGGLFGEFDGNLTDSHASGDISGGELVGGLIGSYAPANVSVYFLNRVSASGDVHAAGDTTGGLMGEFLDASISNSYATGTVTSTGSEIGGFIGYADGTTVANSYASGSVSGSSRAGGFIGSNSGTVTNSYSTGSVTGSSNVGGFIGENNSGTITNGYWNTTISGQSNAFGTGSGDATGLTTPQMIDSINFSGFSFSETGTWNIDDGFSFPYLNALEHRMIVARIDSGEGWRMIGNPGDVTYSELLDPVFTQGYEGSDGGTGFAPNVYFYEESTQTWTAPSKASDYFGKADSNSVNTAFNGILLFVYGDDDGDGNQDAWPKYIVSENTTLNDTLNVSLSYTDNVSADSAGWNLISNPYPVSLDWTEVVTNGGITNTFPVAYIWDDSLNAGAGAYRINYGYPLPPGLPQDLIFDGAIPAMQAFWVKATASDAMLSFKPAYQTASEKLFKQAPSDEPAESPWLNLTVLHSEFSDQLTFLGSDGFMAPKLSTIAGRYVEAAVELEDALWAARSLPELEPGQELLYPIALSTTETGTFTFNWQGMETFGTEWQFLLVDNATGARIDLAQDAEYTFEVAEVSAKTVRVHGHAPQLHSTQSSISNDKNEPRFELILSMGTSASTETSTDLPSVVALDQNYPNPFNPSTNIQFALPQTGNVELAVFDVLGRKVATLINERVEAGYHQIQFNARDLASGMYIYQLRTSGTIITKKLTLIK